MIQAILLVESLKIGPKALRWESQDQKNGKLRLNLTWHLSSRENQSVQAKDRGTRYNPTQGFNLLSIQSKLVPKKLDPRPSV
jgi:hypothetical protein